MGLRGSLAVLGAQPGPWGFRERLALKERWAGRVLIQPRCSFPAFPCLLEEKMAPVLGMGSDGSSFSPGLPSWGWLVFARPFGTPISGRVGEPPLPAPSRPGDAALPSLRNPWGWRGGARLLPAAGCWSLVHLPSAGALARFPAPFSATSQLSGEPGTRSHGCRRAEPPRQWPGRRGRWVTAPGATAASSSILRELGTGLGTLRAADGIPPLCAVPYALLLL